MGNAESAEAPPTLRVAVPGRPALNGTYHRVYPARGVRLPAAELPAPPPKGRELLRALGIEVDAGGVVLSVTAAAATAGADRFLHRQVDGEPLRGDGGEWTVCFTETPASVNGASVWIGAPLAAAAGEDAAQPMLYSSAQGRWLLSAGGRDAMRSSKGAVQSGYHGGTLPPHDVQLEWSVWAAGKGWRDDPQVDVARPWAESGGDAQSGGDALSPRQ
eukprot:TRINITY_DN30740_c0_g1_i2.p3 TRINITY_DN30740_c0_g1~~TRINITY_DN30740_c0_g1_i2.p3  ORF type:complete len:238 (+),score=42.02 TRINITY_DN30740_c0_g1_i2:66-716(+)